MALYLGVDTSNYTTSAAVYDSVTGAVRQVRRLLPVKPGEKGIRQSDAVFHHTQALPELLETLFAENDLPQHLAAAGASDKPSNIPGSYMPCFTVGVSFVRGLCAVNGIGRYYHSHQHGHITAALYSAGRLDLIGREWIAFHVSGGTTEAVLCEPDAREIFRCTGVLAARDLKAGQAIDRAGVMLGLAFPAGKALDALSLESTAAFRIRPSMQNGCPSFSGLQNQCEKMYANGEAPCDIARFCIESVSAALSAMTEKIQRDYPGLPVVYSGGVLSNTIIRKNLSRFDNVVFASAAYSSDNAVGTAVLAAIKDETR